MFVEIRTYLIETFDAFLWIILSKVRCIDVADGFLESFLALDLQLVAESWDITDIWSSSLSKSSVLKFFTFGVFLFRFGLLTFFGFDSPGGLL